MFSATAQRLLSFGPSHVLLFRAGGGGAHHSNSGGLLTTSGLLLAPKKQQQSTINTKKASSSSSTNTTKAAPKSAPRSPSAPTPTAASSSSSSFKGAASELHSAAKLRERSPRSVKGAQLKESQRRQAVQGLAASASIGRPLRANMSKKGSGGGGGNNNAKRGAPSSSLEPLKKRSAEEVAAEEATEAARTHSKRALQKAAMNLNTLLTSAGTSSSGAAGSIGGVGTSSATNFAATANQFLSAQLGVGTSFAAPPPAMSNAQAAFLAQSAASAHMRGVGGASSSNATTTITTTATTTTASAYTPARAGGVEEELYDDGTVDPYDADEGTTHYGGSTATRGGASNTTFDFSKINEMNRTPAGSSSRRGNNPAGGSGTSADHHNTAGAQLIIDDGSGTLGAAHLVFSPLNNRLLHRETPVVQSLLQIGFAINEHSKELYLKNPDMLNEYAHAVRYGGIELPRSWKAKMVTEVGYVLQNPRIDDPASHILRLMESKKSTRRATIGMIASIDPNGGGSIGGGVNSGSAAERAAQEESESQNIVLNKEQREVLDYALKGFCMYIGGSAGTGKTVLLTALKRRLTQEGLRVAMTATTGIAGCHIGGATFHHTFSVTPSEEFGNRKNLLSYDVVVIDEVSMMSRRLFEEFDDALRHEAGINIPFGGVQIILCGDFLQLSPVNEASIIDSPLFKENFVFTRLIQQVRQSQFPEFAKMLGEIRHGACPPLLEQAIKSLPEGTMAPEAINLLPTNVQVREANHKELARIESPPFKLTPRVSEVKLEGEFTPTIMLQVGPSFNATRLLMLAYDFIRQRVQIRNPRGFSLYRIFQDGYAFRIALPQAESALWKRTLVARFLEIAPLIEGWGIGATVHNIVKDGVGLHTAEYEDSLSRLLANHPVVQPQELKEGCRVLLRSNLTTTLVNGSVGVVKGFVPCEKEYVHQYLRSDTNTDSLIEEYNNFHKVELGYPATLPLVQFAEGMPPIAIPPMSIKIGGTAATQYYCLEGIAVPLTLAYAFTVHKVQGLTLVGRVHLELSKMWPCNHLLYVAMSRVKNPDQLSVSGFNPAMIVADDRAVAFDKELVDRKVIEVPSTATVAVWKGFDTYSVTQDFYKSLGGTATSTSGGGASSAGAGRAAAELAASAFAAASATAAATAPTAPTPLTNTDKRKLTSAGYGTSAVSRIKFEKDNAALVAKQNSGAAEDADADALLDESVFPAAATTTATADSPATATTDEAEFAGKSKPATYHELMFQQMAQRGAGSYKYFTGAGASSAGASKIGDFTAAARAAGYTGVPSEETTAETTTSAAARKHANPNYISVVNKAKHHTGKQTSSSLNKSLAANNMMADELQGDYYMGSPSGDDMPPM